MQMQIQFIEMQFTAKSERAKRVSDHALISTEVKCNVIYIKSERSERPCVYIYEERSDNAIHLR